MKEIWNWFQCGYSKNFQTILIKSTSMDCVLWIGHDMYIFLDSYEAVVFIWHDVDCTPIHNIQDFVLPISY